MASAMINERNQELQTQLDYLREEEQRLAGEIKLLSGPRTFTRPKQIISYSSSEESVLSSDDDDAEIPSTSNIIEKSNEEILSTSNNNNEIIEINENESSNEHKDIDDDTNKIIEQIPSSISDKSINNDERYIMISTKTPKRKIDAIIGDMQENVKKYKQDEIEKIIPKLANQMDKMDKRLENLENKFIEKEDSPKKLEKNTNKNIPSIIKGAKSQVIVALRDYWMPAINKRFDSIESRFDRIESRYDSIESLLKQ